MTGLGHTHTSAWDEDEDGFIKVECSTCGWWIVVPDMEDGGDAWGDHTLEVERATQQPSQLAVRLADLAEEIEACAENGASSADLQVLADQLRTEAGGAAA